MTTAATRSAPADLSAAAALWALAPVVHVSSISSTELPSSWRAAANLPGVELVRRRLSRPRLEQALIPLAGRGDQLPDDPVQGMARIPLGIARRHRGDELEALGGRGTGDAPLVLDQMPPEHGGQLDGKSPRDLAIQPLVSLQRVMQLFAGHAVGDRRNGVQPELSVTAGVAPRIAVGEVETDVADVGAGPGGEHEIPVQGGQLGDLRHGASPACTRNGRPG